MITSSNPYRSAKTTQGRTMAGARALWRANGLKEEDFNKPIIAIANSYTGFVPGHVPLREIGNLVKTEIDKAGGVGVEFNTIAIDDGIAMGHEGMLYSLPSRELIADSVEYMVNAHVADALICISACDKITPGMLMATMRLNIPTVFITSGPMEAGTIIKDGKEQKIDLIDAMVAGGNNQVSDQELLEMEKSACPTCGSCAGLFTANSMNCLSEALGISLPGNGTILATHEKRKELFITASKRIVEMAKDYYINDNKNVLPKNIITRDACLNAMKLDIAMGGSTNTILHLLAIANSGDVNFTLKDIDEISKKTPTLCKVAPSSAYHMEDVSRAGGIQSILSELNKVNLLTKNTMTVSGLTLEAQLQLNDPTLGTVTKNAKDRALTAPGNKRSSQAFSQNNYYDSADLDRQNGCIRSVQHAYSQDGGLCVLYGNIAEKGAIVKTAGVPEECLVFTGKARLFDSQEAAMNAILNDEIKAGDCVVIRYEGPKGGPGMQEMLYPTSYIKSKGLGKKCALITDGRFSGGTAGLSVGHISPEAANGGTLALIEENDNISIHIKNRTIQTKLFELEKALLTSQQEFGTAENRILTSFNTEKTRIIAEFTRNRGRSIREVEQRINEKEVEYTALRAQQDQAVLDAEEQRKRDEVALRAELEQKRHEHEIACEARKK